MTSFVSGRALRIAKTGLLAGAAGGIAEILFVTVYSAVGGTSAESVARGVTATLFPALAASPWAVTLGIAIHMILALALGLALVVALRGLGCRPDSRTAAAAAVLLLGGVWAVNFLVALPHINPAFLALLPYAVTLTSKLLFGAAAAAALRTKRTRRAAD